MTAQLDRLTQQLLDAARKAGADTADALAVQGTSVSIDVLNGKLEHAERSEGVDIGLRVLIGQRQACVSASDNSDTTIATMAERAVAMAKEAPEDPHIGLADPAQFATHWDIDALDLRDPSDEPSPAFLEDQARRAEAAALAVKGVSQVQSTSAGYGQRTLHLAASNGFQGGYGRTDMGLSLAAITGEGASMERDWAGEGRIFQSDMPSPEEIGTEAGDRTVARAGAKQPPTGAFPVLFDERIASSLIGHLLSAANGSAIVRGGSWLRDALGEQVLPAHLSLIEDPHRPRISGSRPFDGEGLPTHRRAVVENGVLTGWTLDLATGRNLGMESTANASRGTSAPPSPSISNVTLTPGESTRDDLIAQMGTGLIVTSMIGSTINPTTGDYSRGASGFWVENGQITHAVNECTIAGNLRDMLMRIIPANDAKPHLSRQVPSLLIEGMTLAGA
ncbi:TldD/PmbA family protein [Aliiroseovarius subalbicans]|uniref:TldD/PmbA family protein n=1 Tax=Aliiroseovarius subalbicans TaxID=2925840 RepID=UPI001F588A3B|nr:TldD/PmbA family protein [Aliiroseovarius subalbicans]MCI2400169.1 TldD/PmbA family protein [Aliiroseovarius subalbicans]